MAAFKNEPVIPPSEHWLCTDCAAKLLGWKFPNGFTADAIHGKCPHCGRRLWLVLEADYYKYGRRTAS